MSFDIDTLYNLLPAVHRVRDAEQGYPLRALLAVIADQVAVVEEDLAQLYDDQFIETSREWVVPYIGDMLGVQGLHDLAGVGASLSQRAQVANTIRYRRRKGTAAVLEQLARDVTGWPASVVEYFQRLATTQHLQHLRPDNLYGPDLRRGEVLEQVNTPFDPLAHTADVRSISRRRGRYNIPNVGLFLWRLEAFPSEGTPAARVDGRRYMFNRLGIDQPLFNRPETETEITQLAGPENVPRPIGRRAFHRMPDRYYGLNESVHLTLNGAPVAANKITICNLADANAGWAHAPATTFVIDPVLGRIALPASHQPDANDTVTVSYYYGFSAEMGGGQYDRETSTPDPSQVVKVPDDAADIQSALAVLGGASGAVEITDSATYAAPAQVALAAGQILVLRAADKQQPHILLTGPWEFNGQANSWLMLDGLLISGGLLRISGDMAGLNIEHCTLVPGRTLARDGAPQQPGAPSLEIASQTVNVTIARSISGAILADDSADVVIRDSIVDATAPDQVAFAALNGVDVGGPLEMNAVTVIGKVHTRLMDTVSNTIFVSRLAPGDTWPAPVMAQRKQQGCVRYSFLPPGSQVPRRYRCQPDPDSHIRPVFTSLSYGRPGYGQLSQACPPEIFQGADDEAEMGAFHHLFQPQRVTNLRLRLDEYLRFGLEAGIFFAT